MNKNRLEKELSVEVECLRFRHRDWQKTCSLGVDCPSSPYTDGQHMNNTRTVIINIRDKIKRICEEHGNCGLPEEYYWDVPPEVAHDYIANADAYRKLASVYLDIYIKDANYQALLEKGQTICKAYRERSEYDKTVGLVAELQEAIAADDIRKIRLWLEKYSNFQTYLKSFHKCLCKILDLENTPMQLSLFDSEDYTDSVQDDTVEDYGDEYEDEYEDDYDEDIA